MGFSLGSDQGLSLFVNVLRSHKTYYDIDRIDPGWFPSTPPHFPLDLTSPPREGVFEIYITTHPSLPLRILPSTADMRYTWHLPITIPRGASLCLTSGHLGRMYASFQGVETYTVGDANQRPRSLNDYRVAAALWKRCGWFTGPVLTGGRQSLQVVGRLLFSRRAHLMILREDLDSSHSDKGIGPMMSSEFEATRTSCTSFKGYHCGHSRREANSSSFKLEQLNLIYRGA